MFETSKGDYTSQDTTQLMVTMETTNNKSFSEQCCSLDHDVRDDVEMIALRHLPAKKDVVITTLCRSRKVRFVSENFPPVAGAKESLSKSDLPDKDDITSDTSWTRCISRIFLSLGKKLGSLLGGSDGGEL